MIDSAAIAAAVAMTFLLAAGAAQSTGVGIVAAIFTVVVEPRYYDYDKVLFYTLGLALAWRYADRRPPAHSSPSHSSLRSQVCFAMTTASSCLSLPWRRSLCVTGGSRGACAQMLLFVAVSAVVLAPVALPRGNRHRPLGSRPPDSSLRTRWKDRGRGSSRRRCRTFDAGASAVSALFDAGNRTVVLYFVMLALLPLAALRLVVAGGARSSRKCRGHETPKIAGAIVSLGVLVAAFILRDPVGARLGAAAPVAAILGAWLIAPLVLPQQRCRYGTSARALRSSAAWSFSCSGGLAPDGPFAG